MIATSQLEIDKAGFTVGPVGNRAPRNTIRAIEAAEKAGAGKDSVTHTILRLARDAFLSTALAVPLSEISLGDVLRRIHRVISRTSQGKGGRARTPPPSTASS